MKTTAADILRARHARGEIDDAKLATWLKLYERPDKNYDRPSKMHSTDFPGFVGESPGKVLRSEGRSSIGYVPDYWSETCFWLAVGIATPFDVALRKLINYVLGDKEEELPLAGAGDIAARYGKIVVQEESPSRHMHAQAQVCYYDKHGRATAGYGKDIYEAAAFLIHCLRGGQKLKKFYSGRAL